MGRGVRGRVRWRGGWWHLGRVLRGSGGGGGDGHESLCLLEAVWAPVVVQYPGWWAWGRRVCVAGGCVSAGRRWLGGPEVRA